MFFSLTLFSQTFKRRTSSSSIALATLLLLGLCVTDAVWAQVSVLTQHNDNFRAGANMNETALNTSNVNSSTFGKLFCVPVDGFVYAQPLYAPGVTINNAAHNVLYVATAHDSIYAFDADNGTLFWKISLGTPVPSSVIGTTNIQVEVGIISTPVIDPHTNTIYAVAKTYNSGTGTEGFYLHALDITSGSDKLTPVFITAQYAGSGDGSNAGKLTFAAAPQNQRSALTLVNGALYVAFASHEDHDPYHGWVLVYSASTLQQIATYNVTPNGGRGGIWMSGQGLVADSSNNVYVMTGNSNSVNDTSVSDASCSYGESFLKLSLSAAGNCPGTNISVLDFFKPSNPNLSCSGCPTRDNYDYLNQYDLDLGSGGPIAIPGTSYIVGGGKQGLLYLINTNNMGGFNSGGPDRVVQEWYADAGLWGAPVFWNNANKPTLYTWGVDDQLKAYSYASGSFNTTPYALSSISTPGPSTNNGGDACGALSVSSNQSIAGTGIVWATVPSANPAETTVRGTLYAFDASNVATMLWNSLQNSSRDDFGAFAKFAPPTVANGKVYIATDSFQVCVYGLNPPAPSWHHTDISAMIGAREAAGDPSAYVLGNEIIVYRGTDNHVLQLFASNNQAQWLSTDLTTIMNAPLAAANPMGYVFNNNQMVVYRGTDNHIHQLYTINNNTQWAYQDLTALTNAPLAAGDPFGHVVAGNQVVDYLGTDGHIHQLYTPNQWVDTDLTAVTGAPSGEGDPFEFSFGTDAQIAAYRGVNNHVIQLSTINNNSQWVEFDVSQALGATPAGGDVSAYVFGAQIMNYRGTDNHIHQLYNGTNDNSQWLQADLTALTGGPLASGDPSGYVYGTQIIAYRGSDSHIYQLFTVNNNTKWSGNDLTSLTGAPAAAGDPFGYVFYNQTIVYRSGDGHIHQLYVQ